VSSPSNPQWSRGRRALAYVAGVVFALSAARFACIAASEITPPKNVHIPSGAPVETNGVVRFGESTLRRRGAIWELGLSGDPAARGAAISKMLRQPMIDDERELYDGFARAVPFAPARWAIMDLGRWTFRHVDRGIPEEFRTELAGIAQGFAPDPFTSILPTYHRFVFLYTVYDIALSFEKSPLIGCTTLDSGPDANGAEFSDDPTRGDVLLARAFDMETAEGLDRDKVVFLVRAPGKIPFASVGWPGFVGVVSGMNREGVAMVVHGGRASTPSTEGVPVAFSLRIALASAHTTEEAVSILSSQPVMVSHIVIVTDPSGDVAVIERAPGVTPFVKRAKGKLATTNHFEGPLADDPRDVEVKEKTSTLPRRARRRVARACERAARREGSRRHAPRSQRRRRPPARSRRSPRHRRAHRDPRRRLRRDRARDVGERGAAPARAVREVRSEDAPRG
jgi:hypothetical protein